MTSRRARNCRAVDSERHGKSAVLVESFDLLAPGDVYGDRINVTDLRVAKVLRFGGKLLNLGLDLYNLFNANPPTTYESVYDPATDRARWMQPTASPEPARGTVQRAVRLLTGAQEDVGSNVEEIRRSVACELVDRAGAYVV